MGKRLFIHRVAIYIVTTIRHIKAIFLRRFCHGPILVLAHCMALEKEKGKGTRAYSIGGGGGGDIVMDSCQIG